MKSVPVEVGEKTINVNIYDSVGEAQKALGDTGLLEQLNRGIMQSARAKEHRSGQLENNKKRREVMKKALEYAESKGFDRTKVKV